MEGEAAVRAADERLKSWLRRAGRSTDYGKGYGAVQSGSNLSDEGGGGSGEAKDYENDTAARKLARRCRRFLCITFAAAAILVFLGLLGIAYVAVYEKDEISFMTLGDWGCGPYNCIVPKTAPVGDQYGSESQLHVADHMTKDAERLGTDFVVALGDNFYWRGVQSTTDPLWKTVWEDRFSHPSLQVPWYVILGNHDHYGNAEAQIEFSRQELDCKTFKHCPNRWTLPRYWYSVVIPSSSKKFDIQFVFIDTVILAEGSSQQLAREKIEFGVLGSEYMAKWHAWAQQRKYMAKLQLEWFEQTLNQSTADWLIVAGHYPVFSGGEHGSTPELQQQVKPLLEKYGVDAYLCGHDHTLQHLESNGVTYLVSGSGALNGVYHPLPESLFGTTQSGFMTHRVTKDRMTVDMINEHGATLNSIVLRRKRKGTPVEHGDGKVSGLLINRAVNDAKKVEEKMFKIF